MLHRRLFVIPLEDVRQALRCQIKALTGKGIDVHGLLAYSIYFATASDFETLKQHLIRDLAHQGWDLSPQLVYQCIDFVGEAAANIVPVIERAIGNFDPSVRFEQVLGTDAVISVSVVDNPYEDIAPSL